PCCGLLCTAWYISSLAPFTALVHAVLARSDQGCPTNTSRCADKWLRQLFHVSVVQCMVQSRTTAVQAYGGRLAGR
ncbi:hypothetical protein V8C86DRAFT_2642990, partial [Haematococcus lacustris]